MPYSLMFLLSCGGGCDENPRCFFKNEGFILQVPRTLLGDRPQLQPLSELPELKKAGSSRSCSLSGASCSQ